MRRVGILAPTSRDDPAARAQYRAFTDRLRELGHVEGTTLVTEWRFAEGRFERLGALAAELVNARVEVIVTYGTAATSAARRATATVPIVATTFIDPVASGFAQSLARPGGNVTGFATMGSVVHEKRLEILAEAAPDARLVGLLVMPDNDFYVQVLPGLEATARRLGRSLFLVKARSAKEIRDGFALLRMKHAAAVLVGDDAFISTQGGLIASLALHGKLPSVFPEAAGVEAGGLIGYVNDTRHRYRSAAEYVHRILQGESAGGLPIVQPTKFELLVNARTAAAIGIAIPQSIRARADRVIE